MSIYVIIRIVLFWILGSILAHMGYGFSSWEFWAVLVITLSIQTLAQIQLIKERV